MEFRVLGPLEVVEGGRSLELGGPKQRALLALLILGADRVVPAERLIDDLWDDDPPPTAAATLQAYVSRLRRVLGADRVTRRGGGYALRVEPGELDLERFESLARAGREQLAAGDAEEASGTLRAALALWRGPPLAGVGSQRWAEPDVARLEGARLAAVEDRIEADLEAGRHAEVAGELEALVERHPLRERARMQLMVALYRCGRQAEALAEYGRARRALLDDLGIEPSPPLQLLERRILNQDPELAAPGRLPAARAPAAPLTPLERKLVTVVFADLGVSLLPTGDPERLGAFIADVRETAVRELEAAGGTVERGVADAVLAVFGAPTAQEDHAVRASHAARALLDALDRRFGARVAPRIGVETGEVVVEPTGGAVGAPVMAAGALLRRTRPGEALAGPRTAAAARASFAVRATPHGFLLLGTRDEATQRGRPRAFVDRTRELEQLESELERAAVDGATRVVTLVGEAGIGKTALVYELRRTARVDATWLVARCQAFGGVTAYEPLAAALRELTDDVAGETDTARPRLGARADLAPILGAVPGPGVHPRNARERLELAWLEFLSDEAGRAPVALVVEDVHRAEQPLVDLLVRTARAELGPVVVLTTARPHHDAWDGGADARRVELEPLAAEDSAALVDALGVLHAGAARSELLERGGGNPLFLEELALSLADDPGGGAIPDTVQSVLAARIDRLPDSAKRALGTAAVVGRRFDEELLRSLSGPELGLDELVAGDFVQVVAEPADGGRVLSFKHALTREVAYGSLTVRRRVRLHAEIAERLEHASEPDAPRLAFHLAAAVQPEIADLAWADEPERAAELRPKAVAWLAEAARVALRAFDLDAAHRRLDGALLLDPDATARTGLLRLRAHAHALRYDMDAFRGALEEALECAPTPEARAELAAELARAGAEPYLWRRPPAEDTVDAWIEAALEDAGGAPATRARALQARALRRPPRGARDAEESRVLAERLDDPALLIGAYEAEARVALTLGRYDDALRWSGRALAAARELGDPDRLSGAQLNAIVASVHAGRIAAAGKLAREHAAVAERLSAHHRVHAVGFALVVTTIAGRWREARRLAEAAEEASAANAETPCQFNWRSLGLVALAAARLGDEGVAHALSRRAAALGRADGAEPCDSALLRLAAGAGDAARLAALLDRSPPPGPWDPDLVPARLDALCDLGERARVEAEAAPLVGRGGYEEPFALRALGRARDDAALLERAAERFDTLGLAWRADETRVTR